MPKDNIDELCQKHDLCYQNVKSRHSDCKGLFGLEHGITEDYDWEANSTEVRYNLRSLQNNNITYDEIVLEIYLMRSKKPYPNIYF